jgi:hypothetical protein
MASPNRPLLVCKASLLIGRDGSRGFNQPRKVVVIRVSLLDRGGCANGWQRWKLALP